MRKLLKVSVFLLFLVLVNSQDPTLNDDVLGLIVFKADLRDPNSKLNSWTEDDDNPCKWTGIKCNPRTNRVTDVVLDGFSLSGRIGRGLVQLQFLRRLSLSNNNFTGTVNPDLARLGSLRIVDLSENNLSGNIPDEFFQQCMSLRVISLANNAFSGQIPASLGSCSTVGVLNFSSNRLTGELPKDIWSLNGLRALDLSDNSLVGQIPAGIQGLYNLRTINLQKNQFSGEIPADIGGCSLLKSIDFSENLLSGKLPDSIQRLSLLGSLRLHTNSFVGSVPEWMGNLKILKSLDLSGDGFSGEIPGSLGQLKFLEELNLSGNGFEGNIPETLNSCKSLRTVDFSRNVLTGNIPAWVFELGLQSVSLSQNRLTGPISSVWSSGLGQNLQVLDLSCNGFSGDVPMNIGNSDNLAFLNLSRNFIGAAIPASIGDLKRLQVLDLSWNHFNGSIPSTIGEAVSLVEVRLDWNLLAGPVPTQIGKCSSLTSLILSHNNLNGPMPSTLANLTELQTLDFSVNNLTGILPKQLGNLPKLHYFNISHNNLQGDLPAGGIFNTLNPAFLAGNPSLCGSVLNRSCPAVLPKPIVLNPNTTTVTGGPAGIPNTNGASRHKKIILSISALIAISAAAVIALGVVAVTVLNLRVNSSVARAAPPPLDSFSQSPSTDAVSGKLVMFSGDEEFSAGTHALLNKNCELGRGGFGTVYRSVLRDGRPVAVKKLTVSSLVKSQEDFEKEVKKLGKIRHANLVTLDGFYWTPQLQLLIYEYVSGGSLYSRLHENPAGNILTWPDRFNIILGIAKGLAHLHQNFRPPVVHYNLKSSNILLDEENQPKVGDFGLAKLLPMLDRYVLSSKIQSALGYMAPEFACRTVRINEKSDVYGFGVLVLEVVTGKRPVEYMEDDVVVLCDGVRGALEEGRAEECVDGKLRGNFPAEEVIPVIKLGLICTSPLPSNRPEMGEVVNILELIRSPAESQEELG